MLVAFCGMSRTGNDRALREYLERATAVLARQDVERAAQRVRYHPRGMAPAFRPRLDAVNPKPLAVYRP